MGTLFIGKEKVLNKVVQLPVEKIVPNPHQPRKNFDDAELHMLAESIKQNGILQPLSVRKVDDGYELISGERRLRAAKLIGLENVPCIVVDITERNSAVLAIVENIQRQDLSFFEEAIAIEKLIDFYGMTQEDAAIKLGKAQSTIANKLRLLKLSEKEMEMIAENGLTERHARALLRLNTPEQRLYAIERISKGKLNVERAEKLVDEILSDQKEKESIKKRSGAFKDIRLFINTISKAVETMQAAGINAESQKIRSDGYIEYIVKIPITSGRKEEIMV
ncbi:MAG: ParB family transcriptional regulator, chromosome partitioning protein [Clostridiales bacterium]|jgi:ParB family chromosome partitioning protein|nr:ParB-like partition protein [Oscillospiraceae bacterium]MDN5378340.1 ParB family transcriptional regulator, chromosome partitioning protein [Clostridiales bacterium]